MSQYVSHKEAAEALDSLDDYARMTLGIDAFGPRGMLERYIEQQAALSAQPAPERRSSHAVWRRDEWLPCYCAATADHPIGEEHTAAPVGVPDLPRDWKAALQFAIDTLDCEIDIRDTEADPGNRRMKRNKTVLQQVLAELAAAPSAPQGTQQGEGA